MTRSLIFADWELSLSLYFFEFSANWLSLSFKSFLSAFTSNFSISILPKLIFFISGNFSTSRVNSKSLSSPEDLISILGCPAGFIFFSFNALKVVSLSVFSITSP